MVLDNIPRGSTVFLYLASHGEQRFRSGQWVPHILAMPDLNEGTEEESDTYWDKTDIATSDFSTWLKIRYSALSGLVLIDTCRSNIPKSDNWGDIKKSSVSYDIKKNKGDAGDVTINLKQSNFDVIVSAKSDEVSEAVTRVVEGGGTVQRYGVFTEASVEALQINKIYNKTGGISVSKFKIEIQSRINSTLGNIRNVMHDDRPDPKQTIEVFPRQYREGVNKDELINVGIHRWAQSKDDIRIYFKNYGKSVVTETIEVSFDNKFDNNFGRFNIESNNLAVGINILIDPVAEHFTNIIKNFKTQSKKNDLPDLQNNIGRANVCSSSSQATNPCVELCKIMSNTNTGDDKSDDHMKLTKYMILVKDIPSVDQNKGKESDVYWLLIEGQSNGTCQSVLRHISILTTGNKNDDADRVAILIKSTLFPFQSGDVYLINGQKKYMKSLWAGAVEYEAKAWQINTNSNTKFKNIKTELCDGPLKIGKFIPRYLVQMHLQESPRKVCLRFWRMTDKLRDEIDGNLKTIDDMKLPTKLVAVYLFSAIYNFHHHFTCLGGVSKPNETSNIGIQ